VGVLLTSFTIDLVGATIPGNSFYVVLCHHGNVVILDQSGNSHKFTHNIIKAVYQYGGNQPPSGGSFGGDSTGSNLNLIAISPSATFTIEAPLEYNSGVSLSDITSIGITFARNALPAL